MSHAIRDTILFVVGVAGIVGLFVVWLVTGRAPEPSLLVVFGAMAGLPAFLRADEKRRNQ